VAKLPTLPALRHHHRRIYPVENRIGLLDRKLRVVSENTDTPSKWLDAAQTAYKNTYAFEWQGDSLLLAREAML
jgi:hypothetical protein